MNTKGRANMALLKISLPEASMASTAQCILHNYPDFDSATLRPYECRVYLWEA